MVTRTRLNVTFVRTSPVLLNSIFAVQFIPLCPYETPQPHYYSTLSSQATNVEFWTTAAHGCVWRVRYKRLTSLKLKINTVTPCLNWNSTKTCIRCVMASLNQNKLVVYYSVPSSTQHAGDYNTLSVGYRFRTYVIYTANFIFLFLLMIKFAAL